MPKVSIPSLEGLVLVTLRRRRGVKGEELAERAGVTPEWIYALEGGKRELTRAYLLKLADLMGYDEAEVDRALTSLGWLYADAEPQPAPPAEPTPKQRRAIARVMSGLGMLGAQIGEEMVAAQLRAKRAGKARKRAERRCRELLRHAKERRWLLVEKARAFQTWASDNAKVAVEIARLACRVAELAPGGEIWRSRLRGYCLAFLANALRVQNEMAEADAMYELAMRLWTAGTIADPGLLAEWRVLDLGISLHRDKRRFKQALRLSAQARKVAPPEVVGRLLVKKAAVFEHMGKPERALAALGEAAPLIDRRQEPRLYYCLRFELTKNYCHLDRYADAEALLPEVERLALSGHKELEQVRVKWLCGRVAAGREQHAEARAAYNQVRQEFYAREMAADYALVSLEIAVLDLEHGRTTQVRRLAGELAWIFRSKGIHREALAALDLFRRAALQEAADVELARRVVQYLYRSRYDPTLRFET